MKRELKELFMRVVILGLLLASTLVMASSAFAFDTDGLNNPPVAVADQVYTFESVAVNVYPLLNDYDIDGDIVRVYGYSPTAYGTLTYNNDGTFTYLPNPGFIGTDAFCYAITDNKGGASNVNVIITVSPKNNNPPVAVDDTGETDEATPVLINVLSNDYDVDNDPLKIISYTQGANGIATDNGDGTLTYTPNAGFRGFDDFSYEITDDKGGYAAAKVTVTVVGNTPPVAVDDLSVTDEATPVNIIPLFNDFDVDADPLKIVSYTQGTNGTVTDNGDGTLNYTPNPGFSGTEIFYYTITDGNGGYASAKITINVNPIITIGFMTGGGSIFTEDEMRVTHGFTLRTNVYEGASNLEINWNKGHKFKLGKLTYMKAYDDPNINPAPPAAGFDTLKGTGTGTYNGETGAVVEFIFTDAGQPGINDTAKFIIKDCFGNVVLTVSGKLDKGNHQAHK